MKRTPCILTLLHLTALVFVLIPINCIAKVPSNIIEMKASVVMVEVYNDNKRLSLGSGFAAIDCKHIVTNYHVIDSYFKTNNSSIVITMADNKSYKVTQIESFDDYYDIALLVLDSCSAKPLNLSVDNVNQGDDVVVIGYPMGLDTTISNGIVSGVRGKDNYLQITAPISVGSSGSPVINENGNVIGIATMIVEGGQNLNFAIPINLISKLNRNINIITADKTNVKKDVRENAKSNDIYQVKRGTIKLKLNDDKYIYALVQDGSDFSWVALNDFDIGVGDVIEYPVVTPNSFVNVSSLDYTFTELYYEPYFNLVTKYTKPKNEAFYYEMAVLMQSNYLNKQAIDIYNHLLELNRSHTYYFGRGKSYYSLINFSEPNAEVINYNVTICEQALTDYNKAIALHNNNSDYYYYRSNLYNLSNNCISIANSGLALKDLTKAININSKRSEYYYARAKIYRSTDNLKAALSDVDKAILLNKYSSYYELRGDLHSMLNDNNKAIDDYTLAISRINKTNDAAYSLLYTGVYIKLRNEYINKKKANEAIKYINKRIGNKNTYTLDYLFRVDINSELSKYTNVIADMNIIISRYPDTKSYYEIRANALEMNGRYDDAINDYAYSCDRDVEDTKNSCEKYDNLLAHRERGYNWVYYGSSQDDMYFYDETNVRTSGANIKLIWVRLEKSTTKNRYAIQNISLDCSNGSYAVNSYTNYNKGIVEDANTFSRPKYIAAVPGSIGQGLTKSICNRFK